MGTSQSVICRMEGIVQKKQHTGKKEHPENLKKKKKKRCKMGKKCI